MFIEQLPRFLHVIQIEFSGLNQVRYNGLYAPPRFGPGIAHPIRV